MTRTEILLVMHAKPSRSLFYTMQLGGSMKPLYKMQDEGLISSQARYSRRGMPQRDWYLTEEQHRALRFVFTEPVRALAEQQKG